MSCIYSSNLVLTGSLLGALTLGTLGAVPVQAANFSSDFNQIFVFGDSLSDPGNIFNLTGGAVPENPLSYGGRFSNGPIWTEYFTPKFGLNLSPVTSPVQSPDGTNFAFGGATSGDENVVNLLKPDIPAQFPGLTQQLNYFIEPLLANNLSANPDALYVIWAGSNDYTFGGVTDPTVPVRNLANGVRSLYDVGARNFLLLNLPNLGDTPLGMATNPQGLNQLVDTHNFGLNLALDSWRQSLGGAKIVGYDLNASFQQILQNPAAFGLTNITDSWSGAVARCLKIGCEETPNPDDYLFWDWVHPTTRVHEIIAAEAFSAVESEFSKKVPEPTSLGALSLLGLGFLFDRVSSHRRKA